MAVAVLVVGASGSGKTTLIEKLIPELIGRGYRVGSVKHAHHGFTLDKPGSDSARHTAAGATPVLLVGSGEAALMWRGEPNPRELDFTDIYFRQVDVVIVEGFGGLDGPKILVHRKEVPPKQAPKRSEVLAAITDEPLGYEIELLSDEITKIADVVVGYLEGQPAGSGGPA